MGIVMIRCPSTDQQVSTGIEMSNMDRLPAVTATMVCSACGGVHAWTRTDAWLAEGGALYRKAAMDRASGGHAGAPSRPSFAGGTRE